MGKAEKETVCQIYCSSLLKAGFVCAGRGTNGSGSGSNHGIYDTVQYPNSPSGPLRSPGGDAGHLRLNVGRASC